MEVSLLPYEPTRDYNKLRSLIISEGEEWKSYLEPRYEINLKNAITYVAYVSEVLCGYARSMKDGDYFIWVIDLLVHKDYRGNALGKKLMEILLDTYPGVDVYVMSDVDDYYKKLGYQKEGSIFKVSNK